MTKENVNTPYDDAFRTLLVKCPTLVIPLVNEAFHDRGFIAAESSRGKAD